MFGRKPKCVAKFMMSGGHILATKCPAFRLESCGSGHCAKHHQEHCGGSCLDPRPAPPADVELSRVAWAKVETAKDFNFMSAKVSLVSLFVAIVSLAGSVLATSIAEEADVASKEYRSQFSWVSTIRSEPGAWCGILAPDPYHDAGMMVCCAGAGSCVLKPVGAATKPADDVVLDAIRLVGSMESFHGFGQVTLPVFAPPLQMIAPDGGSTFAQDPEHLAVLGGRSGIVVPNDGTTRVGPCEEIDGGGSLFCWGPPRVTGLQPASTTGTRRPAGTRASRAPEFQPPSIPVPVHLGSTSQTAP